MKDKPDDWLKFGDWNQQVAYIKKINASPLDIHISIVGGEPSLFPKLKEFTRLIERDITIITNLYKIPDVETPSKIRLNISYHAEEVEDEVFINKINRIQGMGFKHVKVNFLIHHSKHRWPQIESMIKKIHSMSVDMEVSFLTRNMKFFKYPTGIKEFIESIKPYFKLENLYVFDDKEYNELTLYTPIMNGDTNFKGYDCYINRYNINIDGMISKSCIGESITIDELTKIDKITPITCPYMECNYNCHLSFTKYENPINIQLQ